MGAAVRGIEAEMQMLRFIRPVEFAALLSMATLLHGCTGPSQASEAAESPPSVVATSPANGAENIDAATTEVSVTFNQPMQAGWSFVVSRHGETPALGTPRLSADRRTIVAPVKLEPGKAYAVWLNSPSHRNFMSAKGRPATPYHYEFKTASR
jgi:hypothetical protein